MAVVGRTFRPRVNQERCNTCSVCTEQCPAYVDPGFRDAAESVRGQIFASFAVSPPAQATPIEASPPPCQVTCPIHQDVRGYLKAVAEERFRDAVTLIRETNPLPLVCGTICPHPCERECFRGIFDDPVGIRAVKRFAALYEKREGMRPEAPPPMPGKKVAIIGSGPAGIAAAYTLIRRGVTPVVFEKTSKLGGMLAWAIPTFRLPREILDYELEVLREMGVRFRTGQALGETLTLSSLRSEGYAAVLLTVGATKGRKVSLEGEAAFPAHLDCLDALFAVHRGEAPNLGSAVAVIGGGNAAIDTARVLKREGVPEVAVIYRRPENQMPADPEEVQAAKGEGVRFRFSALPTRLSREKETWRLSGFETRSQGRGAPVEVVKDRPFAISVTGLVSAISQVPESAWAEDEGIAIGSDGTLQVDEAMQTSREGVYAAGDAVTGPSTVVEAMASGAMAAEHILKSLNGGAKS